MAKPNYTQPLCFLYLIISGHLLVDCRRVNTKQTLDDDRQADGNSALESSLAQSDAAFEEISVGKAKVFHPWCNWFSKQRTKHYHFDVDLSDEYCEDGACMAIELIRHKDNPELHIHAGQSWLVEKDDDGEIQWTAKSVSSKHFKDQETVLDLLKTEVIRFVPSNTDYPEKLEIHMTDVPDHLQSNKSANTGEKAHEVFELSGGLFYSEELLAMGLKKQEEEGLTHEKMQQLEEEAAARRSHSAQGASHGSKIGALSVGGVATAAQVMAAATGGEVVAMGIMGVVGGAVGGAVVGGIVGAAVAVALAIAGAKRVTNYKVIQASRKIFEKLRCIAEFKSCSENVLVPKDKDCPPE